MGNPTQVADLLEPGAVVAGDDVCRYGWTAEKELYFSTLNRETVLQRVATRNLWPRDEFANNELQYYADPDADPWLVLDVNPALGLVQSAHEVPLAERAMSAGQRYASSIITSHGTDFTLRNGRISASIKLPAGGGLFPAFWLYPEFSDGRLETWPLPEIDIMESIGDMLRRYYTNVHSRAHDGIATPNLTSRDGIHQAPYALAAGFHEWGVELTEEEIRFFLNGIYTRVVPRPADLKRELHWILNLAVGGNWAGEPRGVDFPVSMATRYVRIDQLPENIITPDPAVPVIPGPDTPTVPDIDLSDLRSEVASCVDAAFARYARVNNP